MRVKTGNEDFMAIRQTGNGGLVPWRPETGIFLFTFPLLCAVQEPVDTKSSKLLSSLLEIMNFEPRKKMENENGKSRI